RSTPFSSGSTPRSSASLPTRTRARGLLDIQRLHRLREGIHGVLVLASLVQGLAFGALLLHLGHLLRAEFRVLGERLVDLFHVRRAVERKRGGACKRQTDGGCDGVQFHWLLLSQ